MASRKLTLRTEHLSELTPDELQSVAGASGAVCDLTDWCIPTQACTGYYPSLNAPCDTIGIRLP